MLKNAYLLLLAGLPSLAYTGDQMDQCCDVLVPPAPIESCQVPVGYFYPAQYLFGDCVFDISISGQFIYWELNRDSTTQIGTSVAVSNNGLRRDGRDLIHYQGYRPGFRVAAGIGLPGCDNWKVDLEYTRFHHTSTNRFFAPEGGFIEQPFVSTFLTPAFFGFQADFAQSTLKFDLDFLLGTVGRAFILSQRLIVNAGVGLKGWWSTLESDLFYSAPDTSELTSITNSKVWGLGPYVLAEIKGLLWCGTYLYGKAGVWVPYTRFTKLRAETNAPVIGLFDAVSKIEKPVFTTNLFYEGAVGLGWGTYLCSCNYHMDFLVGYEIMTNYNKAVIVAATDPHYEFYYQGLIVKAQFDF